MEHNKPEWGFRKSSRQAAVGCQPRSAAKRIGRMRTFATLADFAAARGEHLGYSAWREVTQQQVNMFADVTGDRQWIHVDPERAAGTQFGGTIAHGYLTLALVTVFLSEIFQIASLTMGINIGLNRVRFPVPVKVGSRVRGGAELLSLKPSPAGNLSTVRVTVEADGQKRPACIAETLSLYVV
jgi:acyl dehydratase